MMAHNNRKNKTTIVHHLTKKIVDFELLWRCISKIRNELIDPKEVHERGNIAVAVAVAVAVVSERRRKQ